jgi:protein-L-isoaspartate(D-aspartate) O-methyltransferase
MNTRETMIECHLRGRDIDDPRVIEAMQAVDRSLFVPEELQSYTYEDHALSIGKSQTISQPYIVAYMAQALDIKPDDKVLEIGTGCGYNAAVLAQLASKVYSIEIIDWLAELSKKNLQKMDSSNIESRHGDGYEGWPEHAPFDAIELTAAPAAIPDSLKQQLKIGGKLLAPVGRLQQELTLLERISEHEFKETKLLPVRFVPMTGKVGN